ncbi:MAG TPA: LLM class flavin-dependent oxidoreductase [Candidatus Binatus sp.]|nr:LLM class flavin-dependent oxidoreductase [Candidatus Binatus sp.]
MKFGLLYEIEVPRPWTENSVANCFWEALEQVKAAEQAGFSHVFVVEHHFLDQFSVSSAPEVWLAAVAQHTTTIRIGHGVRLLPFNYNHPVRAAEMAATLDIMSRGRLDFGTGRSASAIELEGFGIDPSTTRAQWDEALRMIPKMWTQEEFSWDSPTFKVPPRNVLPKPVQKPHPPLWMSGTQPESAVLAGERGVGFMHFSLSDPVGMDQKVRSYREAIARAQPVGSFINEQFAAFTILFCGADDADATARGGTGATWYANLVELVYASLGSLSADQSYAWYRERIAKEAYRERSLQELVDRRSVVVGGPQRCIDTIEWYEVQGVDMMLFLVQAGTIRHADILDSLGRFGREVIPHFNGRRQRAAGE